ncbi:alpha/beta hydrolase [Roseovarius albus]|uniref:alpha/beta hydrolase n=1 Tax=Roseovarius albus TaxID=1247867 RepID=UPI0013565F0F|nr:alpha/beta hydrolase [Roseovarius albus]
MHRLARSFEWQASFLFPTPRGVQCESKSLQYDGRQLEATHVGVDREQSGPLILYIHGGAFVCGSAITHQSMVSHICLKAGAQACLPNYRLATAAPFPAAVDDVILAYTAVMAHPGGVVLGGDSAGGNLALVLLGEILRQKLPKPLGCFCFSPVTDLAFSGESFSSNASSDSLIPITRAEDMLNLYVGTFDPNLPTLSPLQADFKGAPPVWLAVSDQEVLLDDTLRMAQKLRAEGVNVTEIVERGLPHVWPIFQAFLPEGRATLQVVADWINSLSSPKSDS